MTANHAAAAHQRAGYIQPINPPGSDSGNAPGKNSSGKKEKGGPKKGWLRNVFGGAARFAMFSALFGPIALGLQQCTVNTEYGPFEYEALTYAGGIAIDGYKAEGQFVRDVARTTMSWSKGWFGPVIGEGGPGVTYASTPHVLVCTPNDLQLEVNRGTPEAATYNAMVQTQLDRRIHGLNNPKDYTRQQNPNMDFVIMINKKPANFDYRDAEMGLRPVLSTVAVKPGEWACPPARVKSESHPQYRPEYKDTTYSASWRFVPGLKPPGTK